MNSYFARPKPTLNLALQGGGAHGAFTWGVLDYLLEQGFCRFEGISGTSAGSMNAVAVAQGLMEGGPDEARACLQNFWDAVSANGPFQDNSAISIPALPDVGAILSLVTGLSRYFSPYMLNPIDINPLRTIVERLFDFEQLRKNSPSRLFISATHASSGQLKVFHNHELSSNALLASACLPTLHHTIEVDGEPYWDGGYSANPAIFPLYADCGCKDLLLILLSPTDFGKVPLSAEGIRNRAMEISFNAAFLREMNALAAARAYAQRSLFKLGKLERRLASLRFHQVDPVDVFEGLSTETKLRTNASFLYGLRDLGRERAEQWLDKHEPDLGRRSSMDLSPYLDS